MAGFVTVIQISRPSFVQIQYREGSTSSNACENLQIVILYTTHTIVPVDSIHEKKHRTMIYSCKNLFERIKY